VKKKLCFATFVFGEEYQSFLPLYIYSVLSNYNNKDYGLMIFLDKKLNKNIKNILSEINILDCMIFENYFNDFSEKFVTTQVKKSLRWLIYNNEFKKFDSIYFGDVDIFICNEQIGIYEQHLNHCKKIRLPYSNIIRNISNKNKINIKTLLIRLLNFGIESLFDDIFWKGLLPQRMSGLHFIIQDKYFPIIYDLQKKYIEILRDKNKRREKFKHHIGGLRAEALLYDLIKDSGLGLPKKDSNEIFIDFNESDKINFRPHHGIHLGIFRSKELIVKEYKVLTSKTYIEYYKEFCEKREKDRILRFILEKSPQNIKKLIYSMDEFYKNL
jgi:hypothetical protein